jgi:hypothetical protein
VQIQEGMVDNGQPLTVYSEMDDGVVFGDGIEQDRMEFTWGARLEVRCASRTLRLVRAASRYN